MIIINISDFSRFPSGRYLTDGSFSAELFRTKFLLPAFQQSESILINLDDVAGYGSNFLEEAFGGLVREGITKYQLSKMEIQSENESLKIEILEYIEQAQHLQVEQNLKSGNPVSIKDVQHSPEIQDFIEQINSGKISFCSCMGKMYGEPECPCVMERNNIPRSEEWKAANSPEALAERNKELAEAFGLYK
jgi:hypothetical protein